MRRVLREGLQGRKAFTAKNMKFSGGKNIAAKSGNILPYFKVNLSDSQTKSSDFRSRRYSKTSVRAEIRPKIGHFRYKSDIRVVLPDL